MRIKTEIGKALKVLKQRRFYRNVSIIAIPIAIQHLLSSVLNIIDQVMVGQVGADALAGVTNANQVVFMTNMLIFGICGGITIFIAQGYGAKDTQSVEKDLGLIWKVVLLAILPFVLAGIFIPDVILTIFTPKFIAGTNQLVPAYRYGKDFLDIIVYSLIPFGITVSLASSLRNMHIMRPALIGNGVGVIINTVLNYALIFGAFGLPALGPKGAAIATVIARLVEMTIIVTAFTLIIKQKGYSIKRIITYIPSVERLRTRIGTAAPVIINELFWGLGISTSVVIFNRLGTEVVAAVQIGNTLNQIFIVIMIALGNSAAIILGKKIGENQIEEAKTYGVAIELLCVMLGVGLGVIMFGLSFVVPSLYKLSSEGRQLAQLVIIVYALLSPVKTFNGSMIIGTLRSGGDTVYAMIAELMPLWLIGIPLAILGVYLGFPAIIVVILFQMEEVVKSAMLFPRLFKFQWANRVV
ncbi:MAG: MATE family efflux transporter [Culicoidibacterales bacterium]